jgi:hypothetical protein
MVKKFTMSFYYVKTNDFWRVNIKVFDESSQTLKIHRIYFQMQGELETPNSGSSHQILLCLKI